MLGALRRFDDQGEASHFADPDLGARKDPFAGRSRVRVPALRAELHEAVALKIHHYNTKRIHTALKTTPAAYAAGLKQQPDSLDMVLQKRRD